MGALRPPSHLVNSPHHSFLKARRTTLLHHFIAARKLKFAVLLVDKFGVALHEQTVTIPKDRNVRSLDNRMMMTGLFTFRDDIATIDRLNTLAPNLGDW